MSLHSGLIPGPFTTHSPSLAASIADTAVSGGTISVASEVGAGTTFTVRLPR
ncbi:hypothetical protein [Lentzea atacamensis]|uniref:hypothetical protein n=1 Tax=Lentzea atacamensis TaxID=531938 RepID=UPI001472E55C|nr:hypothetical protein [Lentzea atacamensis]